MELEERFWSKADWDINNTERCWEWMAYVEQGGGQGYGKFRLGSRMVRAHRLAYELEVGEIPEGMVLDHLCRNRRCVNPTHLEPVTKTENILRGEGPTAVNARKTHCEKHGTLLTPRRSANQWRRTCTSCDCEYSERYRKKRNTAKSPPFA